MGANKINPSRRLRVVAARGPVLIAAAWWLLTMPAAADQPHWDLYGRVNVSADYLNDGDDGAVNFASNSSRIGLRGGQGLQPGLELVWQVEQGVDIDRGGSEWASRNSYLGLRGGWGEVRLGQHDTPLKMLRSAVDMSFSESLGDTRNVFRSDAADGDPGDRAFDYDTRFKNSLLYLSPMAAGLQAALQYTTEAGSGGGTTDSANAAWSGSLSYTAGPVRLIAGHQRHDKDAEDSAGEGAPRVSRLGAKASLGRWAFTVLAQRAKNQRGEKGADRTVFGGGAGYRAGDLTIQGQAFRAKSETDADDTGADLFALGAEYRVTPETRVYGSVAAADNDDNAAFRISHGGRGADVATVTGEDPWGIAFGLRHDF